MKFDLFTDGACQPNPGQGGWAFILYPQAQPDKKIVCSGYEIKSTNNRMELTAVIKGLEYLAIQDGCASKSLSCSPEITLFADSKYILQAIGSWMKIWVKNDWKRKDNKPVLNSDLWKQIHFYSESIPITCVYVKGHSGHPENEECDQLAVAEIKNNR